MSERAPYSRVYWTVRNDPRLSAIYSDDHHWAAWSRLLLTADMAWPAPADLPGSVRKASVEALVSAGVIELLPGGLFTFHGLDTERGRRADAARASSAYRTQAGRSPNGTHSGPERLPSRAETRRDETSLAEHIARDGLPNLTPELVAALEERTGQPWSLAGDKQLGEYDRLVGVHGAAATLGAIDAVRQGRMLTARQVVWAAMKVLEPMPDPKRIDQDQREAERAASSDRAVLATLVRVHQNGAHADESHPRCPSCQPVPA